MFYVAHVQTSADAPFTETNLQPDTGTARRLVIAEDVLYSFTDWANEYLASVAQYDDALLFTAYVMIESYFAVNHCCFCAASDYVAFPGIFVFYALVELVLL